MQLKICGLTKNEDILELSKMEIDRMGFIFYEKSQRFVANQIQMEAIQLIPLRIKKTGVFVNETKENVKRKIEEYNLDSIQLHGTESPEFCEYFKNEIEVIKTFSIKDLDSFKKVNEYENCCHLFLFDTYSPNHGGTGIQFNWQLINEYKSNKSYLLSGGIGIEQIETITAIKDNRLIGIDINSKVELEPGKKDLIKIKEILKKLNKQQ